MSMQCPKCKTVDLVVIEREGVEIDYCPNCRGVWLERNELDTIIKRSTEEREAPSYEPERPRPQNTPPYMDDDRRRYDDDRRRYDDDDYHKKHYKKKKGGFLEDLFDF